MKKSGFVRIIALAGAVLLVVMYILTVVFAVIDDEKTMSFFWASVALTIIVPIFIYANQLVFRVIKSRNKDKK